MAATAAETGAIGGQMASIQTKEDRRREKLVTLQQREKMKDALVTKFRDRHSGMRKEADEVSLSSSTINHEVSRFCGTASMTQNNLQRLERRLQGKAKGRGASECDAVTEYSISSYTNTSQGPAPSCGSLSARGPGPLSKMAAKSFEGGATPTGSVTARSVGEKAYAKLGMPSEFDWSTLDKYAATLHQEDAKRQRAGQLEVKQRLKADLDRQVADQKKRKEKEKAGEKDLKEMQEKSLRDFQEKEQLQKERQREKADLEKKDRDVQLQIERRLREERKLQQKAEGEALISKIEEELVTEKDRIERKKAAQKELMAKVREENESKTAHRMVEAQKQRDADSKLMADYAKKLDEQDRARAAALEERIERQKKLNERMGNAIAATEAKAADEMAQRAERQRIEKEEATIQKERQKKDRLKQIQQETQAFLFEQMQEKELAKKNEKELKMQTAQKLKDDSDDFEQCEQLRSRGRRLRNVEHREELEKQIAQRVSIKRHAMSESEMMMNKELVQLVSQKMESVDEE